MTITPIRELKLSTGSFDQDNTFTIAHPRRPTLPMRCSLHQGYHKAGDGVFWAMQHSGILKSSYTQADRDETARLNAMAPLQHGEIVRIDGRHYRTRILGDFSNAAIFDEVPE